MAFLEQSIRVVENFKYIFVAFIMFCVSIESSYSADKLLDDFPAASRSQMVSSCQRHIDSIVQSRREELKSRFGQYHKAIETTLFGQTFLAHETKTAFVAASVGGSVEGFISPVGHPEIVIKPCIYTFWDWLQSTGTRLPIACEYTFRAAISKK